MKNKNNGMFIMENNKIFLDNVYFLIREHQLKIGEFEREIEVSNGYLSRLNKDSTTMPTLEVVQKIAGYFNVGIDTILKVKMNQLSPSENKMIEFVEKLIREVSNNAINWTITPTSYFYEESKEKNIITYLYEQHCLENMKIIENGIYLAHIDNVRIVLVNIHTSSCETFYNYDECYEMYMLFEDGTFENIYRPADFHSILDDKIYELYHLISINMSKVVISSQAVSIIDNYLK